jgi:AcrR family transcriptional regulator
VSRELANPRWQDAGVPKAVDHDQRRAELAEAARRLIAKGGLEAATVRAISAEAGYSTGVLTHVFPDKDAVVLAALNASIELSRKRREQMTTQWRGRAGLRELLHAELPVDDASRSDEHIWIAFWAQAAFSERLAAEQRAVNHEWRALILRLLAEGVEDGDLREGLDLDYEADRIVAIIDGLGTSALFDRRYWTKTRLLATIDRHVSELAR